MLLRLVESLGPPLIRALGSTLRVRILPEGVEDEWRRTGRRVIYSFWHGRMLIPAFTHRFRRIAILVSRHRDGEVITRAIERLGFRAVRGSTTRGGVPGLIALLREAKAGHDLAFTPDGPRGPRYRVQRGVVYAASRSGLPVVPAGIEVSRGWVLGSWDEFTIPKPFATAVILLGEPMSMPGDLEGEALEAQCRALEAEMHRVMRRAKEIALETPARRRR
jgi:lysophospholipid acyltransferase (LPLAT)-like uncharacterized protein